MLVSAINHNPIGYSPIKTLAQIALATIFFTTSMMVFAEPATINQSQSKTATTTVKHEAMTVTLTDKHL
ncbi:hypothetical protein CWO17_21790 [Vibrio sp. 10N.286.45.A3]|nr:hypothetical protein CWO17_21790 [Vibrio sp. 10N.286.45.A3]PTQ19205.1 hypothetical protein CWO24_23235 [Vibrio sp. 10N.286.46.E10]TKE79856.1 hypothetical protein FCV54_15375 [Vibrio sp. F12]TKE83933.1 hypothetical protein FCV56_11375 [Vibrio sp. F12]TKE87175.1 hypothetical protein FCV53_24230 [Vibrio sp. F12]